MLLSDQEDGVVDLGGADVDGDGNMDVFSVAWRSDRVVVYAQIPPPHLIVTSNADSGPGSLRQAIADAGPGYKIYFDMTKVVSPIVLTGELLITEEIAIVAPGSELLTVSGGGNTRLFYNDHAKLYIEGLTIANGLAAKGGAIYNDGTYDGIAALTVNDSVFVGNSTIGDTEGGAIFNGGGAGGSAVTIIRQSKLSENQGSMGGAITPYPALSPRAGPENSPTLRP